MAFVFEAITVDGRTMRSVDAMQFFDRLGAKVKDRPWVAPLTRLVYELICYKTKPLGVHTSGTTGAPKPLRIPRRDLVNSARLTAEVFGLKSGDRALMCLPGAFIAGRMMIVRSMVLGLDLHLIDPRGSLLDNLRTRDRFRFAAMVPLQLHRAIQEDRSRVEEQFDTILLGGGPVSAVFTQDIADLRVSVYQGYGSTETVTHVALRALNAATGAQEYGVNAPFRAIGKVSFGRDPRGCLVVYTPHLSVKQHVTNDLVELIDDTAFRWLGRFDNVILSGGKKIFPEGLEARTSGVIPYAHYFTATPDDVLGQTVMLVLETDRPQDEVLPEVMERIMEALEPHEWPRRVQAIRSLQRTGTGKVIRHQE
ncbi:MAG TPA: AMP-binding protein [Flavobacteriales bacterium]|nr:AMP-binding protein [Flavobacteriales bacterium]